MLLRAAKLQLLRELLPVDEEIGHISQGWGGSGGARRPEGCKAMGQWDMFGNCQRTQFILMPSSVAFRESSCFLIFSCCHLVTKLCPTLATPWIVAHQAPLSTEFPTQEYLSELPFPSPGDLLDHLGMILGWSSWDHLPSLLDCRWILYHWATWEAQVAGKGNIS